MANRMNGFLPGSDRNAPFICERASADLPVYPNGYVTRLRCSCGSAEVGRSMLNGEWVKVCMRCGYLRIGK